MKNAIDFAINFKHRLIEREFLLDLFTFSEKFTIPVDLLQGNPAKTVGQKVQIILPEDDDLFKYELTAGKVITTDTGYLLGVLEHSWSESRAIPSETPDIVKNNFSSVKPNHLENIRGEFTVTVINFGQLKDGEALLRMNDTFVLRKGMIANFNGSDEETTIGRFILNYVVLVDPFHDIIPYLNDVWTPKKVESQIIQKIMDGEITREMYSEYMDNVFFIGHFTQLCVPTLTTKAWTTDPNIAKRKKELLSQYSKEELKNPLIAAKIEDELIAIDKAYMKGDPSLGYLVGEKSFNVHRKKMFLTVGSIESFSEDATEFTFIPNSLAEGWDPETLDDITNEIRRGSYSRGKATAKGGEETKFLMRVFQNTKIDGEDCGTRRGLVFIPTKDIISKFIDRTVIDEKTGEQTLITKDNMNKFVGKKIVLRSPMTCESKHGICYACIGEIFAKLGMESIGLEAIVISSTFLTLSMKNMHGTKVSTHDIDDITNFFIGKR